ncbi:MAG: TatD family hydrolase [Idiomarina sp.]
MPWFDAGVNLTNSSFADHHEQVLQRAAAAGVSRMVVIGTCLQSSREAVQLAERYPQQLVATVGIHPHDAAGVSDTYIAELRELAAHPLVRAIGECGLDFNRNYSPPEQQLQVFREQLDLAAQLQLPVYLHERDALTQQLQLLNEFADKIPRLLTHCFTAGREALEKYLQLGCYIGITGWICDERRGDELRQAVKHIPADRLLLETDGPFLLPRTLKPKPKSRVNEPAHIPHIAGVVAALREQPVAQLEQQCWHNSLTFFGTE